LGVTAVLVGSIAVVFGVSAVLVGSIAVVFGVTAVLVGSIAVVAGVTAVLVGSIAVVAGVTAVLVGSITVVAFMAGVVTGMFCVTCSSSQSRCCFAAMATGGISVGSGSFLVSAFRAVVFMCCPAVTLCGPAGRTGSLLGGTVGSKRSSVSTK
jgi:hypothetical protein